MKAYTSIFLFLFIHACVLGQFSVRVTEEEPFSDLNIQVDEEIIAEDLSIELGENIILEHFSIGFTSNIELADIQIMQEEFLEIDFTVNLVSNFADFRIECAQEIICEDLRIEIKDEQHADFLIYTEASTISKATLICSLLPIINSFLEKKDQLKGIPIWKPSK